jgi:hypothetical protein
MLYDIALAQVAADVLVGQEGGRSGRHHTEHTDPDAAPECQHALPLHYVPEDGHDTWLHSAGGGSSDGRDAGRGGGEDRGRSAQHTGEEAAAIPNAVGAGAGRCMLRECQAAAVLQPSADHFVRVRDSGSYELRRRRGEQQLQKLCSGMTSLELQLQCRHTTYCLRSIFPVTCLLL